MEQLHVVREEPMNHFNDNQDRSPILTHLDSPIATKRSVSFATQQQQQQHNSFYPEDESPEKNDSFTFHSCHSSSMRSSSSSSSRSTSNSPSFDKPSLLGIEENDIPSIQSKRQVHINRSTNVVSSSTTTTPPPIRNKPSTTTSTTTNAQLKQPIVPSSGYGKFGQINFRADNLSMICKKWTKNGFWLHVYPATINLFDNQQDMEQWKQYNDTINTTTTTTTTTTQNNNDTKQKRIMNQLVKKSINFDTTGALKKKMMKLEEKSAGGIRTPRKNKVMDSESKKNVVLPRTYVMEEVRSKHYNQNEPLMHTCKISYLGLSGRHVIAALGSNVPQELKRFRAVVRIITKLVKKTNKKHSKRSLEVDTANETWKISASRSEITALSNTIYGQNTSFTKNRKR